MTRPSYPGTRRSPGRHQHHLSAEGELREALAEATDAQAHVVALMAALRHEQKISATLREQVRALLAEREAMWAYQQACYAQQLQRVQTAVPLVRTGVKSRTPIREEDPGNAVETMGTTAVHNPEQFVPTHEPEEPPTASAPAPMTSAFAASASADWEGST